MFAKRLDQVRHLCGGSPGVAAESGDHSFQVDGACPIYVERLVAVLVGVFPGFSWRMCDPGPAGEGDFEVERERTLM